MFVFYLCLPQLIKLEPGQCGTVLFVRGCPLFEVGLMCNTIHLSRGGIHPYLYTKNSSNTLTSFLVGVMKVGVVSCPPTEVVFVSLQTRMRVAFMIG